VLNQHFGVFHVPGEWRWGVNGHKNVGQTLVRPAAGAD
jgi:hypothetical protein